MGQERYLSGVALHRATWAETRPGRDHDHCAFCMKKIWDRASGTDEATAGFTTADDYHWICEECFIDFRERFRWVVAEHPNPRRRRYRDCSQTRTRCADTEPGRMIRAAVLALA